jgi:hypothetical protein
MEPLLEDVDLDPPFCQYCGPRWADELAQTDDGTPWCMRCDSEATFGWILDACATADPSEQPGINWVIVGGESGTKARPLDLEWARSILRQCRDAGVPCFVKQLGSRPFNSQGPIVGSPAVGITEVTTVHPKGEEPSEWPADLRVREFPS